MDVLNTLKKAVSAGEAAIEETKKKGLKYNLKEQREYVTNCDFASEKAIIRIIKKDFENSIIFSEESGKVEGTGNICWVVDPIDGTHNFLYNLPDYGISIAACKDGVVFTGIIRLPAHNDTFYAIKGKGAFQNDRRISVSSRTKIEDTLIAYDNQFHRHPAMLKNLEKISNNVFTLRIMGSAVTDIARVCNGSIDARVFNNTKWVDFAAGSLIVKEAGGLVTNFKGEDIKPETTDVIVSNGKIHKQLVELLEGTI